MPGRILVMGGTEPGHTTDAVAAMLAARIGAGRVVNATSVDAVYSADPRSDPNAERYTDITIGRLEELVYTDHGAGKSSVFDPLGVKVAKENHTDIMMVNGRNLPELEKAIAGDPFDGTFIRARRPAPCPWSPPTPHPPIHRALSPCGPRTTSSTSDGYRPSWHLSRPCPRGASGTPPRRRRPQACSSLSCARSSPCTPAPAR